MELLAGAGLYKGQETGAPIPVDAMLNLSRHISRTQSSKEGETTGVHCQSYTSTMRAPQQ